MLYITVHYVAKYECVCMYSYSMSLRKFNTFSVNTKAIYARMQTYSFCEIGLGGIGAC